MYQSQSLCIIHGSHIVRIVAASGNLIRYICFCHFEGKDLKLYSQGAEQCTTSCVSPLAVCVGLQERASGCCCWLCNIAGRLSSISVTSTDRHARPILPCCLTASWLQHCRPSGPHQPGMENGTSIKPGEELSFLHCAVAGSAQARTLP